MDEPLAPRNSTPPDAPAAPAGWYADPSGARNWRWWDGTRWSEHTAPYDQPRSQETVPETDSVAVAGAAGPVASSDRKLARKRGTCLRCGGKLTLRQRVGDDLCANCEPYVAEKRAEYRSALSQLAEGASSWQAAGPQLVVLALEAYFTDQQMRELHEQAIRTSIELALADDVITTDEETQLVTVWDMLGNEDFVAAVIEPYWSRMVIAKANNGRLDDITDRSDLLVKRGEIVHLEVPAAQLKEVALREFRGGYKGVSFRIAKGVTYRVGGGRGHSVVVGTELQTQDTGHLSVTSKRAVFVGTRGTVEMPYSKLVGLQVYADAISMNLSNRKNAPLFAVESPDMVAAVLNGAAQESEV
jgi:uncharacterized protein DUF2510